MFAGSLLASAAAAVAPTTPLQKAIYYTWSSDGGASFTPDRKLMDRTCECCWIALARERDGNVAAFFRGVHGENIRDHAFAVLRADDKIDHPQRVTLSGRQLAACPHQTGSRNRIEWRAARRVVRSQLRPGGLVRPTRCRPSAAAQAQARRIGRQSRRRRGARPRCVGRREPSERKRLRASHDNGDTFGAPHAIAESADAVYSPQLLLYQGRAYVAWNTAKGFRLVAVHDTADAKP